MNYFIVKLTDGTLLDFRGMCNHVDMKSDERYIFYHKDGEGLLLQTLAVIPLRSIYYILTCTKEKEVENQLKTKVSIEDRGNKGKIIISYNSLEEFERIYDILNGEES